LILIFLLTLLLLPQQRILADNDYSVYYNGSYHYLADNAMTGDFPGKNGITTDEFTIQMWAWFNWNPTSATDRCLFWDGWYDIRFGSFWAPYNDPSWALRVDANDSGTVYDNYLWQSPNPVLNQWQHIAITWDGYLKEACLYLDADLISCQSGSNVSDLANANDYFTTTTYKNSDCAFIGFMDDYRVYDYARTEEEIENDYDCKLITYESGLIANYDFENNCNDSTSNNNGLTAVNSPTYSATNTPYIDDCGIETPQGTSTTPLQFDILNDLSIISGQSNKYATTGVLISSQKIFVYIPFLVLLIMIILTLYFFSRIIMEIIIRLRQ